ncbi:MAG TPA: hypothetical protein VKV73_33950 [Chloroflexota bacterium]|nr:hypothetical protein [Chloroflexota bacterium]
MIDRISRWQRATTASAQLPYPALLRKLALVGMFAVVLPTASLIYAPTSANADEATGNGGSTIPRPTGPVRASPQTFRYTSPGPYTADIPAGATSVKITAAGAQGGGGYGVPGGRGARIIGTFKLASYPGVTQLEVVVGDRGGDGKEASGTSSGGGGGGGSFVWTGSAFPPSVASSTLLIAAGGGGGGDDADAGNGGRTGQDGGGFFPGTDGSGGGGGGNTGGGGGGSGWLGIGNCGNCDRSGDCTIDCGPFLGAVGGGTGGAFSGGAGAGGSNGGYGGGGGGGGGVIGTSGGGGGGGGYSGGGGDPSGGSSGSGGGGSYNAAPKATQANRAAVRSGPGQVTLVFTF